MPNYEVHVLASTIYYVEADSAEEAAEQVRRDAERDSGTFDVTSIEAEEDVDA